MKSGSTSFYYHRDRLGSIVDVTSAAGAPQWAYSYDPFGEPRTTNKLDPAAPANFLRFVGQQLDEDTGLYYLRARMLDPVTGRFLSTDPVEGGSLNNYDYAGQDPINAYDLDGQICWRCVARKAAGAGLIIGGVAVSAVAAAHLATCIASITASAGLTAAVAGPICLKMAATAVATGATAVVIGAKLISDKSGHKSGKSGRRGKKGGSPPERRSGR